MLCHRNVFCLLVINLTFVKSLIFYQLCWKIQIHLIIFNLTEVLIHNSYESVIVMNFSIEEIEETNVIIMLSLLFLIIDKTIKTNNKISKM